MSTLDPVQLTASDMWFIIDALEDRINILQIDRIFDGVEELQMIIGKFPDKEDLADLMIDDQ